MVSAKRLAQLASKWQKMAAMGRKRNTQTMTVKRSAEECCAMKGHYVVYTTDGGQFEVPLAYLSTAVFGEHLRMSQEEFGFAGGNDGNDGIHHALAQERCPCGSSDGAPELH